jgi:hypothetical protein
MEKVEKSLGLIFANSKLEGEKTWILLLHSFLAMEFDKTDQKPGLPDFPW